MWCSWYFFYEFTIVTVDVLCGVLGILMSLGRGYLYFSFNFSLFLQGICFFIRLFLVIASSH